jgi:EpsD family peptidyl-prolyl cis-trans isomerase
MGKAFYLRRAVLPPGRIEHWMNTPHKKCMHLRVAGWLMLAFLCACGADSNHESEPQVLAKVNGDEITVRELNDRFSRIESRSGLDTKVGKKQVLDALIDEKLLVQRAIESGLVREPETIVALDRARRQVLAQAAIDQAMGGGRVTYRETKAFYEGHPDLFERRKTYVFRRFDLLAGELQPSLKAELDKAGSSTEVGWILKRGNVGFRDQTEIRAAEMLPADVLKQAAEMQRGDILIFKEARQIVLMQLTRSIADPVDLARATPAIRYYLADGKRKNAAEFLLKDLHQGAKIEYSEGLIDGYQLHADAGAFEPMEGALVRKDVTQVSTVSRPR